MSTTFFDRRSRGWKQTRILNLRAQSTHGDARPVGYNESAKNATVISLCGFDVDQCLLDLFSFKFENKNSTYGFLGVHFFSQKNMKQTVRKNACEHIVCRLHSKTWTSVASSKKIASRAEISSASSIAGKKHLS